ncbi:hypothetical protein KJ969_03830 [Patescibacteria group bacterium]|nr:hypothetical protein [Patescibacteria group bacterium]
MTDMLEQGSSSVLGIAWLIEELCRNIQDEVRNDRVIHAPMEARFYNRSLEKKQIALTFYDFCGEILRLWYREEDGPSLETLIDKDLEELTVSEHGSTDFISSLARSLMRLQLKIERRIKHEYPIKRRERIGLLIFEKNSRAYDRLVWLARAFQELVLYNNMASAVLNYQNAVGPSVLLDLLGRKISREWLASFEEKHRIGTQVSLGADYLMTDLIEFPDVYWVLAVWCRRTDISIEHLEQLKNYLIQEQADLGIEFSRDYIDRLSRERLEQMGYDILAPPMSN